MATSDTDEDFVDTVFSVLSKESSATLIGRVIHDSERSIIDDNKVNTGDYQDNGRIEVVLEANENCENISPNRGDDSISMILSEDLCDVSLPQGMSLDDIVGQEILVITNESTNETDAIVNSKNVVQETSNVQSNTSNAESDSIDSLARDPDFSITGENDFDSSDSVISMSGDNDRSIFNDEQLVNDEQLINDEQLANEEQLINDEQLVNDEQLICPAGQNAEGEPRKYERKRQRKAVPDDWQVNRNKRLRMMGKKYVGFERKSSDGKMVVVKGPEREERKLGVRCSSTVCQKSKKRFCEEFSDDERKKIFQEFWSLSWGEKEIYVQSHISVTTPKTRKGKTPSRRSGTLYYHLKSNGVSKPVCKKFFLSTLGIKEWMAHNWVKKHCKGQYSTTNSEEEADDLTDPDDPSCSGDTSSTKGKVSEKKKTVNDWLDSLPKLPSHYCRKDSKKLYLDPIWDSKTALYERYKTDCISNEKPWGSKTMFFEIFYEKNLSIYIPRKDQCDVCSGYKTGNISADVWEAHKTEKDCPRTEKDKDKELAENGKIYCLTADVEAVKVTPFTLASAMYYKTKLCNHNYTVYNLSSHQCTCYWFSEVEGDLTANTFASCIIDYLEERCLNPKLPIVIYTDGCTNQNRNQYLSNALLHFSKKHGIEVIQKYLIKGHTQMEGDSVHALIERKLKNKEIYIPYELVKYSREARQNPFPYDAKYLYHNFFKDYSKSQYYDSIRPGRKAGDPVVTDIHVLQYLPEGKIMYKLKFNDAYKDLPRRPRQVDVNMQPTALYTRRLPIPSKKWHHLQELKSVIPREYHNFYDQLPYN